MEKPRQANGDESKVLKKEQKHVLRSAVHYSAAATAALWFTRALQLQSQHSKTT